MKKVGDLLIDTRVYARLCEAKLINDMAQRIMYSILPAVSNSTQVHHTQGVVDYNALKYAIAGRKNVIKFGLRACVKEMKHYGEKSYKEDDYKERKIAIDLLRKGDNFQLATLLTRAFAEDKWVGGYGGKPWENIAKSLLKLISYDNALQEAQNSSPRDYNAELQIMQSIVIELNVFDGLAHNTKSIMSNLITEEVLEQYGPNSEFDVYDIANKEYQKIERMMDAKEQNDPFEVYKDIEPTLMQSGDINKFKDWASKLRTDPRYRQNSPQKAKELFEIRFRKETRRAFEGINGAIDALKRILSSSSTIDSSTIDLWVSGCFGYINTVSNAIPRTMSELYLPFVQLSDNFFEFADEYNRRVNNGDDEEELKPVLFSCVETLSQISNFIAAI